MSVDAISLAERALDGLHMRGAALAYNMANVGTPHFRALQVDFEGALRQAAREGQLAVDRVAIEFRAASEFAPGDDRREDLTLVDLSNNAMRFSALADMTARRFAILSAAIGAH